MGLILEGRGVSNKKKRSKLSIIAGHRIKNTSILNNLSDTCKLFNSKTSYGSLLYKTYYKCKECRLKDYKLVEYPLKRKKKSRCEKKGKEVIVE